MPRYQHWQNRRKGGDLVFVTTTALDFASVFRGDEAKQAMAEFLLPDHALYGAASRASRSAMRQVWQALSVGC